MVHKRTDWEKGWNDGVIESTRRYVKAGYVAVESLIEYDAGYNPDSKDVTVKEHQ